MLLRIGPVLESRRLVPRGNEVSEQIDTFCFSCTWHVASYKFVIKSVQIQRECFSYLRPSSSFLLFFISLSCVCILSIFLHISFWYLSFVRLIAGSATVSPFLNHFRACICYPPIYVVTDGKWCQHKLHYVMLIISRCLQRGPLPFKQRVTAGSSARSLVLQVKLTSCVMKRALRPAIFRSAVNDFEFGLKDLRCLVTHFLLSQSGRLRPTHKCKVLQGTGITSC
jgi:hypothetical protein